MNHAVAAAGHADWPLTIRRPSTASALLILVGAFALAMRLHASARYESMHFTSDAYLYYVHAHSWYFDGDCDYGNNLLAATNFKQRAIYMDLVSVKNFVSVVHPVGVSLVALPLLVLADGMTSLHNAFGGAPLPRDGFSGYYHVVIPLGMCLVGVAGLVLCHGFLSRYFPPTTSALAVGTAWLGTSLLYFLSAEPTMSHALEMTLVVLMVRATDSIRRDGWTFARSLLLGLSVGLMVAVRYYDIVWVAVPLIVLLPDLWARIRTNLACTEESAGSAPVMERARPVNDGRVWLPLGLAGLSVALAALCLMPQVWVNLTVEGDLFGRVATRYAPNHWFTPQFYVELLQPRTGLLVLYPLIALAVVGAVGDVLRRRDWIVPAALLLALALSVWIYSASFVPGYSRRYTHAFVLFAWGIAAVIQWGGLVRARAVAVSIVIALLCLPNAARYALVDRQRLYRGIYTCGDWEVSRWIDSGTPITTSVMAAIFEPPVDQPPF